MSLFVWLFVATILPSVSAVANAAPGFDRTKPFYLTTKLLPASTNGFTNPTAELKLFICQTRISGKPVLCIDIHGVQSTNPVQAHLVGSTIQMSSSSNGTAKAVAKSDICSLAAFGASMDLEYPSGTEGIQYAALECGAASSTVEPGATTSLDSAGVITPAWSSSAVPNSVAHWEFCPYTTKEPESKYRALSFIIDHKYSNPDCVHAPILYARNVPDKPSTARDISPAFSPSNSSSSNSSSKSFYLTADLPGVSDRAGNPAGELKFFTCPERIAGKTALCVFISGVQGAYPTPVHLSAAGISATIVETGNASNKTSSCALSTFGAEQLFDGAQGEDLISYSYWQCDSGNNTVTADHSPDVAKDGSGAVLPRNGRHWALCPYSMTGEAALYRSLASIDNDDDEVPEECSIGLKVFARSIAD